MGLPRDAPVSRPLSPILHLNEEKNPKKNLSCVRERSPEGGSDLSEKAKSYQRLDHEKGTQKIGGAKRRK